MSENAKIELALFFPHGLTPRLNLFGHINGSGFIRQIQNNAIIQEDQVQWLSFCARS